MENLIEKPTLNLEVKAEIKTLGTIEDNISEIKEKVIQLNKYYKDIIFTEETIKQAKDEKANINKFKKVVADYRKNIVAEYKKPVNAFENISKETEKLLEETYNTINLQVASYEDKQKQEKEQKIKDYFEEYKTAKNIDFVAYERANINVTLIASIKSLKEQVKAFIDKIVDDLNLIETQEHKAEILVEYKQTLNVSNAITTVTNRFKAIEEEKARQEELKRKQLEEAQRIAEQNIQEQTKMTQEALNNFIVEKVKKPLEQPIVEQKQEEILILNFKVKDTRTRLKQIQKFLDDGGYDYE